jgi:hypothetical protein
MLPENDSESVEEIFNLNTNTSRKIVKPSNGLEAWGYKKHLRK